MELERTSLRRFGGTNAHVDTAGAPSCSTNFPFSENISLYLQHYIESPLTMPVTLTYSLHSYNPGLYSPRDQIVGTGAAVKTIDDVGCRVRDGKSAIGAEFSPKVCKRREGEGLRALLILAPDNRFTLLLNTFSPSGHFQTVGTDTKKKELSRRCKMTRVDGQTQGDDERGTMRCLSLSSTSKMSARKIPLLPPRPYSLSLSLLVSLFATAILHSSPDPGR